MDTKGKTAHSAITLTAVSILTKPTGFIREVVVAAFFGASAMKDAFLIAWAIPNIVASFVVEGLNQVMVPIFIEKIHEKNEHEAWKIASVILNIIVIAFFLLALLIILLAPILVKMIAPSAPLETRAYAISMTRLLSFSILALAVSALLTSILNSYRRFIPPALTFGFMNLVIIGFVLGLHKVLGIYSLVLGTLIGTAVMVLIQIPWLLHEIVHYKFSLDVRNEGVLRFGRLMGPMIFATFIFGLMGILEKVFASGLPVGSISSLDYAYRIINFITSIFIVTITTASFPTMSLYALDATKERFTRSVWSTLKVIELMIIPISTFLIVYDKFIIKGVYERGAFTPEATYLTASVMSIFAAGLFIYAGVWVLFHAFYAMKDTAIRIRVAIIILLVYTLLNALFIRSLGIVSLPLSNALAFGAGFMYLFNRFIQAETKAGAADFVASVVKMIVAALAMITVINLAWSGIHSYLPSFYLKLFVFCLMFMLYLIGYVMFYIFVLRDNETKTLIGNGLKRFLWKRT